jgi:hypothetical protein
LAVLAAPFYINDFANIWITDFAAWLAIDYLLKAFVLAAAGVMAARGILTRRDLGLVKVSPGSFIAWIAAMAAIGLVLDQYAYGLLEWLPSWKLGGYPGEPGTWLYAFDLWFGLALVAFTEELVFRGLAWNALRSRFSSTAAVYAAAALLFGLIHWSLGLPAIIVTALIGAAFMLCVHRTGSIWPVVVAHFVVNLVYFW